MIIAKSCDLNPGKMEADVFLMCDNKNELIDDAEIIGLPEGYKIAPFSKCMTKSKELAIMGSDGQWQW